MKRNIKLQTVSAWSIALTSIVAVLCLAISCSATRKFHALLTATDQYILCEDAARQLQSGSDYLTEQVRLFTITGQEAYMDRYFEEAETNRSRERAVEALEGPFGDTCVFRDLQAALDRSRKLMDTEYYAMRLVLEATGVSPARWPEKVKEVELSGIDDHLPAAAKQEKAQQMVTDGAYQAARTEISNRVTACMTDLSSATKQQQGQALDSFRYLYRSLKAGVIFLLAATMLICLLLRRLVVRPLQAYNQCIARGEIFPMTGAAELQHLAVTYNEVFQENQETQLLIRHQAEHDPLTDLLNRGAFERVLHLYESGARTFAIIIIDVDVFKTVNDTFGHPTGDAILKKVACLLTTTFRSVDYICRIGGDEFAVVMVEITSDLQYTISEKLDAINQTLSQPDDGLPAVSLSAGVAFSDRQNPGPSIFKDADTALYHQKKHGKHGCSFY